MQKRRIPQLDPLEALPLGITKILEEWGQGERAALDRLMGQLYDYLHGEARRHLSGFSMRGDMLQPTLLVNEAYLKLVKKRDLSFLNRQQFFWFASRIIRDLIVDHIRAKTAQKRGKGTVSLDDDFLDLRSESSGHHHVDPALLLSIDTALSELERGNPRRAQVVTLRYILGLNILETAEILEISKTTVKEEWAAAKLWLFKRLHPTFSGRKT
ncbi:Sigma-70 family RNA polymerase sigma factor [Sulfidibacter corallicola]|uniref:Sigma-70 family RNA polymerase sigma factor n=1 Tax=Sulfidibacter corallicola TaxID=2818388 RepID=A0A8A4U173_SULCO|nr:ECF-type sigma factor [Sulfidibacter corallicola]QTD52495.1 sigma-70 family RNA polymerase sigma factor [Sulfidibacter corallicola]